MKNEKSLVFRILSLAKGQWRTLVLGTVFLVLSSGTSLLYPQAVRRIVDEALTAKDLSRVDQMAMIVLVVFLVQAITSSLRYLLFTIAGERIVLDLRKRLYGHILDQEVGFFDFNKTGELMSRISSDATILQNTVSVNISMGLRNLAGAVGGLVLMIYTSPTLALGMLLVIPPVALSAVFFGKRIRLASRRAQDALAESSTVAEETISGLRTVRSFAQEKFEKTRYGRSLKTSMEAVVDRIRQISWFMGVASAFGYASVAAVLWYGGRAVVAGQMTVGDLTQFLLYLMLVAFSVGSLGGLWGDLMSAVGAAKRVFEILDREPEIKNLEGKKLAEISGLVEFRNVEFAYPTRPDLPVLKSLSFRIEVGGCVALVGTSGSGKSTVASLLARFYDPLAGEILLDSTPIRELEPNWLRQQIGVVSQEPILISDTIEANIKYGLESATEEQVITAAKLANVEKFVQEFPEGFKTLVGERGIQLSGGQKQRVAIARAILKNPKILILDEATSALDAESESLVQEALQNLMMGRTTLIIAHRLGTIRTADTILVMSQGRVVESGTHEKLLSDKESHYSKLINRQIFFSEREGKL